MPTITDRAQAKIPGPGRSLSLATIQAQLGTRREAVTAQNFGLRTIRTVIPAPTALGGSTGTIVYVTIRNPGSNNARASVTAWRFRADGTGTVVIHRIIAGTVTVELLGVGE